jgi:hypothetical protein
MEESVMVEDKVLSGTSRPGVIADNVSWYSEEGVDLTLIRWMLSLTPTERLEVLQDTLHSIARLKGEQTED